MCNKNHHNNNNSTKSVGNNANDGAEEEARKNGKHKRRTRRARERAIERERAVYVNKCSAVNLEQCVCGSVCLTISHMREQAVSTESLSYE